jgi:carbamoyl-phosphate synthase large subunit
MTLRPKPPWNVLVLPAASEIGLEIHRALKDCKEVVLHGANLPGENIAAFHFRHLHNLPSVHDKACLDSLQKLITAHNIEAIFPAHDDAVVWLAEHRAELEAEVLTVSYPVAATCRSKRATYDALKGVVPVPQVWRTWNAPSLTFPVFVKPDRGQGSQRARRIENSQDLERALASEPDLLISECLTGPEYTVDCFSQRGKGVLFTQARIRGQTRTGISTITRASNLALADEWAQKICARLELNGVWFFQIKEDATGRPKLLEVAPRVAGSMALSRVTGPNFPLLTLYEAAGHDIEIDAFASDISMGRSLDIRFLYDQPVDALYMDLDDTLIRDGQVNPQLMALIFQCRNRNIPVHLLTHHPLDVDATLKRFRLSDVFDRVIHLPDAESPKSDFVTEQNAVLVDDSFRERHMMSSATKIRCFDSAGAVCLIDQRG